MIPHPSLFIVSRYEKRDTEKRLSEIGNCPQYCSVYWPKDTEFVTFQGGHKCQCDWRINYSCIKIRKTRQSRRYAENPRDTAVFRG